MRTVLLDTGPLVALLDAADSHHTFVRQRWAGAAPAGPLITTAAVVTEAMFHLQNCLRGPRSLVELLADFNVRVDDVFTGESMDRIVDRMDCYRDTPMDFADATLVELAQRFNTAAVLTLDERGFRTYRFGRNRAFELLLQK
jgi:uncharacterized protein